MSKREIKDRVMFTMALPRTLLERIDNYRYKNHIPSRAEAVRHLVELGLKAGKGEE